MPSLRKNRRIETRWGVKYYTAVRNAVFLTKAPPYVPPEPPPSLRENVSDHETLYMCTQCKDCFHFRSSLDDHLARKSWILGYWCEHCFMTVCTHNSTVGLLCSECSQLDHSKRDYLQSKGLNKNYKYRAIRVFYNQCQFFAHLKAHSVTYVHMGDLMLMPLPATMTNDWSSEMDITCEALMEHAFLMKVHIMDWLKSKGIDKNWWQITANETEDSGDHVVHILRGYKGRYYFKPLDIPIEEQVSIVHSRDSASSNGNAHPEIQIIDSLENTDKRKSSPSVDTAMSVSDESAVENEDNPCTVNDIAFVDCGPASKNFEPEISVHNGTKKHTTVFVRSAQDSFAALQSARLATNQSKTINAANLNSISSDVIMSYGNTMITPKLNTKDSTKSPTDKRLWKSIVRKSDKVAIPIKVVTKSNIVKVDKASKVTSTSVLNANVSTMTQSSTSSATKTGTCKNELDKSKQSVHTLTVNSGQKIVTFQSSKHIDINTIITQLPPHILNGKKIVFIGQDSNNVTVHNKQELPSKKVIQLVSETSHENGMKTLQAKMVPLKTTDEVSNKNTDKDISKIQNESNTKHVSLLTNKVLFQNGRKYIIKQSSGTDTNLKVVSNIKMLPKETQGSVQLKSMNGIPPLIPLSSTELENMPTPERVNSLHTDVSPLTPSPSPSELSSSSSCEIQSKKSKTTLKIDTAHLKAESADSKSKLHTRIASDSFENLSFHKGDDENLYLHIKYHNQKPIYTIVDTTTMITKCKHDMLNEFFHLSHSELKKRYEHLQQIHDEILSVMDFVADNIIMENLKAVTILRHVLKHCIDKCGKQLVDTTSSDPPLNEWENELARTAEKSLCKSCNKITKPKFYIPGFSKPAKNDVYCSCYRHVCEKCHTYQGNSTRFVAHQTFHDKEKPYLCPDCYRRFNTFKALEIHTWSSCFHTLKKRILGCKICEVNGFQDMESVARHFAIMHSHNKIACDKCYIVLPSYAEYAKHRKAKHPDADEEHPIRLVLCKLGHCIVRCEDYMLHMEKHLVVQRLIWFKCPFCTFVNVEAKRIMSHLQSEHLSRLKEIISSDVLSNILPDDVASSLQRNQSSEKFTNAYETPCEDGTIVPKIINTRTITSEVFERGPQEADELLATVDDSHHSRMLPKILDVKSMVEQRFDIPQSYKGIIKKYGNKKKSPSATKGSGSRKVQANATTKTKLDDGPGSESSIEAINADMDKLSVDSTFKFNNEDQQSGADTNRSSGNKASTRQAQKQNSPQHVMMSRPPPLARIPQHIIESNRIRKPGPASKGGRVTSSSRYQKSVQFPQRIALNGPNNSKDVVDFTCHLCGELINTSWSVLSSHFQRRHFGECKLSVVTSRLLRMSPEFINGGYKDLLASKKRKSENGSSNAKRRRRWTPKKYREGKNTAAGLGLCVKQLTAEDSEGKFRCKKCDQRCSDMANLREHIANYHRIRGRYLICLECGDNFVVAPSLQMHLKAFHGIEDPIAYMASNTSYAPESNDDFEITGKTIEANQCHVCMAVFEDKAAVDKHLRVHGMAFLNRKRIEARNALKSTEKKSETDEDRKSSSDKSSPNEPVRKDKPTITILDKITATM
ncbi:uncharacterized protein LOC128876139 [Hylaeus volcanicus]|uniref:uncharacterized protein LOC128876139 n=1 Tax=Hylaeus volcanicus TaxID=313075 RepID=UPI0023B8360B|nr:uncharacterized protein LOC128876139 [Hylaeus volcanicus]